MLVRATIKIYIPVVISITLLLLLFFVEKGQGEIEINPKFWGVTLFTYKPPLSNIWLVRTILLCSSVAMFSSLLFADYSSFFPDNLRLQVFFDQGGIRATLRTFSEDELKKLEIPENYEKFQKKYYDDANVVLREILKINDDTTFKGEELYSTGDIKFVVRKCSGIQKYYIERSSGRLDHTLEKPNMIPLTFTTLIERRDSRHDYLSPSLKDIFIKRAVIIQPRFKQIFSKDLKSEGKTFDHILVCATKVYLFPIPRLSNTIYMTELEGIGLVPIGYGIYR